MQIFSENVIPDGNEYRRQAFCCCVGTTSSEGGGGGTCRVVLQHSVRSGPQQPLSFGSVEFCPQHAEPFGFVSAGLLHELVLAEDTGLLRKLEVSSTDATRPFPSGS
jgi:hypothetical protein